MPQYLIVKSKIFSDIEVFQNLLEKRDLLMTSSFIFDEVINKVVSGQQIINQSRKPVNYLIDCHHFTMGIACPDFNCMSYLELEILDGRHICFFYYNCGLFPRTLCLHMTL